MKTLIPLLGQAGIGDMSAVTILVIVSIWPYHVANLFTTTPASYSLSKSLVQSGLLLAFAIATVLLFRRRGWRLQSKLLCVFIGYPFIVFGSNLALGL